MRNRRLPGKALLYSMLWNSAPFHRHPNGLPPSGGSVGQGLARSVFCLELFRNGSGPKGCLRYHAAYVCGVNSVLFC